MEVGDGIHICFNLSGCRFRGGLEGWPVEADQVKSGVLNLGGDSVGKL